MAAALSSQTNATVRPSHKQNRNQHGVLCVFEVIILRWLVHGSGLDPSTRECFWRQHQDLVVVVVVVVGIIHDIQR